MEVLESHLHCHGKKQEKKNRNAHKHGVFLVGHGTHPSSNPAWQSLTLKERELVPSLWYCRRQAVHAAVSNMNKLVIQKKLGILDPFLLDAPSLC